MNDDREDLTVEEALAALNVREGRVHCFMPAGPTLVGAEWPLEEVRNAIEQYGAEAAGPMALNLKHGVSVRAYPMMLAGVAVGDVAPVFFATREDWNQEQRKKIEGETPA